MKKCISHFSAIALAAVSVSACTKNEESVALVSSGEYGTKACWFDQHGDLVAFLVLAKEDRIAVPYLISAKCLVSGDYSSYGEAVLHHLNTMRMIDSYGSMHRALPGFTISDNLRSDQPVPSSDSRLYYFRARLKKVSDPYKDVYAPVKIVEFRDMNLSFERFLDLSKEGREKLLQSRGRATH